MSTFDHVNQQAAADADPRNRALPARLRRPRSEPFPAPYRLLCGSRLCGGELVRPLDHGADGAILIELKGWHLASDGVWTPGRASGRRNRKTHAEQAGYRADPVEFIGGGAGGTLSVDLPLFARCPDCGRVSVLTEASFEAAMRVE